MTRIFAVIFLVLSIATAICAQGKAQTHEQIIWSGKAACDERSSPGLKAKAPECSRLDYNGQIFYIINFEKISYVVSSRYILDSILAAVQISNNSGGELDIDPSASVMHAYVNEEAFLTDTGVPVLSVAIPAKKVRSMLEVSLNGKSTGSVGAAPTSISRETANNPGRPSLGVSISGPSSIGLSKAYFDNALVKTRLADKDKVAGFLFYKAAKLPSYKLLVMRVNQMEFVFPFGPN